MNSLGSRLGTSQTQDFVLLGLIALGAYVVYEVIQGVKTTANIVGGAASAMGQAVANTATAAYKDAQTLTQPMATALANAWLAMNPLPPSMGALGNVVWPDGTKTPLSQLNVKQDSLGNVYVSDGRGMLFQLQPSNANGDFPAALITDPSQIGQSPQSSSFYAGITPMPATTIPDPNWLGV